MKKTKVFMLIIAVLLTIIIIISGITYQNSRNNKTISTKQTYIDKILSQKEYSYLPTEAKEYIKQAYEETGEVMLTEKNKEDYKPYLNPNYVDYLELTDEEKRKVEIIPESSTYDFAYNEKNMVTATPEEELPDQYDLRTVDSKNYVTPVKSQGSLGLCWAFSGIASIESNLLKTGVVSTDNPAIFNERTIDYIRAKPKDNIPYNSTDGQPIQVYEEGYNPYTSNGGQYLGYAGWPSMVFGMARLGYALQPMEGIWSSYFTDHPMLKINQVFNFKKYSVTDYILYPELSDDTEENAKQAYYNILKKHIMQYGALSISALAPSTYYSTSCYVSAHDTYYGLVNDNEDCNSKAPSDKKRRSDAMHGMAIVGWNDNYEQSYCGLYNEGITKTNLSKSECENQGGTYHNVKGVWIVKNSWGTSGIGEGYINIAYESDNDGIEGVTRTIERDFDKFYDNNKIIKNDDESYIINLKKGKNKEILKRIIINVNSYKENDTYYDVYLDIPNKEQILLKHLEINNRGAHSIDVNNYILDGDEFNIIVKPNKYVYKPSNITVFTLNKNDVSEKNVGMNTSLDYYSTDIDDLKKTILKINLTSNNMSNGEKIIFTLLDSDNNDISNKFTDFTGYSVLGTYNQTFTIEEVLPTGEYTLIPKDENGLELAREKMLLAVPIDHCFILFYVDKDIKYQGKTFEHTLEIISGSYELELNKDYTISGLDYNAGTHTVTINGIGNFKGGFEETYTINPKELTIKIKDKTITYDKDLTSNININDIEIEGLVDGETPIISGTFTTNYNKQSGIGEYELDTNNLQLLDNGSFKASNYTIKEIKKGKLTVNKAKLNYTIPTNIKANQNQKLSEIELPSGFEWMDSNTIVTETGNYKARAFNLDDRNNYETVENIDIPITVIVKHTITFNSNNGTPPTKEQIVNSDTNVNLEANTFTKTGYKFSSWNTKADGTGTKYNDKQEININKDLTLYAMWTPITYKVIYNSNDNTNNTTEQTLTYDIEAKLNKNTFTKGGYKFTSWNTKADGTGTTYTDEQVIKNLTNKDQSTINLYAIWKEEYKYIINKYTLDEEKGYINKIGINTTISDFKKNIELNDGYTIEVETKKVNNQEVINTGGKTKIYYNGKIDKEFTNIVSGDTDGNGIINYLDYVKIYNHIQKTKNPSSDKKLLTNEYLIAADMSSDNKVTYMDYVKIYNKIKELKGGVN